MAKEYFKKLQEQIEKLEDGFDIKNVEIGLLESEMQDTIKPYALLQEQSYILFEMLSEVIAYGKKHPSDRITSSKNRLLHLLGINSQLSNVCSYNQSLKLFNKEIVIKIQLLRVENAELKRQIENFNSAVDFGK